MPISINGSGTITGISVGGLENGCVNADDLATAAVTNGKLAANAVTIDKLGTTEQSQLCKAWVNFNGTGTVAIRASYNVSSITDNGTGDYTVNFTSALPDANYCIVSSCDSETQAQTNRSSTVFSLMSGTTPTTTQCRFIAKLGNFSTATSLDSDRPFLYVSIFR